MERRTIRREITVESEGTTTSKEIPDVVPEEHL
jgi:hypothetical protein